MIQDNLWIDLIDWAYHVGSHPFSLRQLQCAVAVADTRSFRRAAARCHVSQPSLSAHLVRRLLTDVDVLLTATQQFRDPLTLLWSEDKTASVRRDLGAGRLDAVLVARLAGRPAVNPRAPGAARPVRVGHRTNGGRR